MSSSGNSRFEKSRRQYAFVKYRHACIAYAESVASACAGMLLKNSRELCRSRYLKVFRSAEASHRTSRRHWDIDVEMPVVCPVNQQSFSRVPWRQPREWINQMTFRRELINKTWNAPAPHNRTSKVHESRVDDLSCQRHSWNRRYSHCHCTCRRSVASSTESTTRLLPYATSNCASFIANRIRQVTLSYDGMRRGFVQRRSDRSKEIDTKVAPTNR